MSTVAQLAAPPPIRLNVVRWIGFKTIVIREYGRIIRIWAQTIVPSVVTAVLYFAIFGSLIGRRVGVMGGFDYKQYIAPGLIMMSVITNSYGNVVASFFGAKFGKHVEELLVSPLPNWVIVGGYASRRRGARPAGRRGGEHRVAGVHASAGASPAGGAGGAAADFAHLRARGLSQRAVCQELRPGELDPGLRADAAHLFRRRVLLGQPAAGVGAPALVRQPDPLHGQCVSFRVPRRLGRRRRAPPSC